MKDSFFKRPPEAVRPICLSPAKAAIALDMSQSTLARLAKEGRISRVKFSKRRVGYLYEELERYVRSNSERAGQLHPRKE